MASIPFSELSGFGGWLTVEEDENLYFCVVGLQDTALCLCRCIFLRSLCLLK